MIFVHGAGCDNTFWALLNRYYFFKGYSTLAINLPGHGDNKSKGLSSIDDMAKYIVKIVIIINIAEIFDTKIQEIHLYHHQQR